MKKIAFLLSCSMMLGCMTVSPVFAGEETTEEQLTDATPEELYDQVLSTAELTIDEALDILIGIDTENADILDLCEYLQALQQCEGMFIQEKDEKSTEKTYTATISFHLENGTVMCAVDYDNYGGELSEATVESLDDDPNYMFVTRPKGVFYGNSHSFEILLGEDDVHIAWGSNEYHLYRSDGAVEELENAQTDFEQSTDFQTISNGLASVFDNFTHSIKYINEETTVYVFVELGEGTKLQTQQITSIQESWNNMLTSLVELTGIIKDMVTLNLRDGFDDMTEGHCTIMFVEKLKDSDVYYPDSIIGIVSDGEITYDCLDESSDTDSSSTSSSESKASSSVSGNSGNTTMTNGEKNALKEAESYLKYSSFSYSGLIEQLEFEGYSTSEATYAADHCGANWKEQAVKTAESYLKYSSFSYSGLIEQLEFEGFTHEQAIYGADMTY